MLNCAIMIGVSNRFLREQLVALSLALCLLNWISLSECFSTASARARKLGQSTGRNVNNLISDKSGGYASKGARENIYTANYITAIEDDAQYDTRAFMVATTDHNYAIYSPSLLARGWLTVTVNGDQVFIVTTRNLTISTSLFGMEEQQRDFIAEARGNFTQNLSGLKFAHYTSGSSTHLNRMGNVPQLNMYGHNKAGQSVASLNINQMDLASRHNGELYGEPNAPSTYSLRPTGSSSSSSTSYKHIENAPGKNLPGAGNPSDLLASNGLAPSATTFFSRSISADGGKVKRTWNQLWRPQSQGASKWQPTSGDYNPAMTSYTQEMLSKYQTNRAAPVTQAPPTSAPTKIIESPPIDPSRTLCSSTRISDNFNYYNLIQAPLNVTLAGDVYYFDLHCNILDVYSSTVSIQQVENLSALYRDFNFFSYARSDMPLAINRFFLSDDQVFFVYNDGSVLVKMNWMLDQTELGVVVEARQRLKLVGHWQDKAADLLAKSVAKKTSTNKTNSSIGSNNNNNDNNNNSKMTTKQ